MSSVKVVAEAEVGAIRAASVADVRVAATRRAVAERRVAVVKAPETGDAKGGALIGDELCGARRFRSEGVVGSHGVLFL